MDIVGGDRRQASGVRHQEKQIPRPVLAAARLQTARNDKIVEARASRPSLRHPTGGQEARLCYTPAIGSPPMRRVISAWLLLLIGVLFVAPLVAASSEADVPACCRRTGKHHCNEHVTPPSHGGNQAMAPRMKCPMGASWVPTFGNGTQVLPAASGTFFAAIVVHPAVHAQVESLHRICCIRTQQKRGPPVFVS